MTSLSAFLASPTPEPGALAHSRSALALAIAGHVIGAIIMVKLLEAHAPVTPPPLIVEILQPEPEVQKVLPPPPRIKPPEPKLEEPPPPKPPEPKVEVPPPPPPDVLPEPLPAVDIPPPPRAQPVQAPRREPVPEPPQPVVQPAVTPPREVRRPVQPVQAPPPPVAAPRDLVREVPAPPVLTAKAPSPVQMAVEQPRLDRPIVAAPEAPRVAPREPPRRPLPDAAPSMDVAAAPMPESDIDISEPEPAPLPIGPVPEGPEISLDAASLTALYLRNPKPGYPAASRRLAEQGTVYVRAFINVAGEPKSVELKKSSGYPRLDRAALDAIKGWKFVPARRDDKPVEAAVIVPMKFTLGK
jgi:protein TonB